jgi:peptidyl-prolyl cis-trans isomerase D
LSFAHATARTGGALNSGNTAMFDLVTKHKRIAQGILALIAPPFAFLGVDYYFRRAEGPPTVADVGGDKVTQAEFEDAMRDQQARMRQTLGKNYDPAMFDSPEVRYALVEQLINQRLLERAARNERFRVSDAQLRQFIGELPPFQEDGKFSNEKYRQVLATQNMTPEMFQQRVRAELSLSPLQEPIVAGSLAAKTSVQRYLSLLEQQRDVAVATLDAEPYLKDTKVDDAQAKDFYDKNAALFQIPEQARFEYVMLNQDALAAQVSVDADEVRRAYEANVKQYSTPEERQASHILITVKPDASDADKAAAKQKAEALLAEVKASPDKFAAIAKASSQDPGSAPQGGDLGTFARGSMVKPFEDAVFAGKVGDIVGPVQTDFGYHVIRITGITPAKIRPLDEVKSTIEADLKRSKASQKFAAAADQFQNLVYENADSLAPVAKALDLKVTTTPFVARPQAQALALNNAHFVDALFSPESVQAKRNTEAMEVAPGTLMAGRILEYKPAAPRPFDEVKDDIKLRLARTAASEMAQKAGRDKLALLTQGKEKEAGVTFGKPVSLNRNQVQPNFTPDALKAVFQADPAKLPAYAGAVNERGGYSIYKITKVTEPPPADEAKLNAAGSRVSEQLGRELMSAYLASLKAGTEVKLNQSNLEKK